MRLPPAVSVLGLLLLAGSACVPAVSAAPLAYARGHVMVHRGPSRPAPDAAVGRSRRATPRPGPTLTLVYVGIAHYVKGQLTATHVLRLGENAVFLVAYRASGTPTARLRIARSGQTVYRVTMKRHVAQGLHFFDALVQVPRASATIGTYVAHVTVRLGATRKTRNVRFSVKR